MNDPAALFHDFDFWRSHGVLAAVSGGGDSLALLLLLHDHLKTLHPSPPLYAATVDHGLRTGSAAEAQTVSELCGKLGLAHVTLRWNRSEGGRATPQAARDARYRLLAEAAQRFGVHAIATGHTRDDQAETVAMRLERGTGRGAAGMATISSFDEGRLWIARPLLGVTRQALRAELRRLGVDWIDDPTNENPAQERVRVRNALATAPERAQALLARANKASATRESEALQAAALLHASAVFAPPFGVRLDLAKLEAADKPIRLLLLAALVAVIGGLEHLPAQERVASVWERISGSVADAKRAVRASLGRCTLTVSRRTLSVRREARNLPSPVDPHKAFGIWDGRYSLGIVAGEPLSIPCGFVIAPLDAKGFAILRSLPGGKEKAQVWRDLACEPFLWRNGVPVAPLAAPQECEGKPAPSHLGGTGPCRLTVRRRLAPFAQFASGYDLALVDALAALFETQRLDRATMPAGEEILARIGAGGSTGLGSNGVDTYVTNSS